MAKSLGTLVWSEFHPLGLTAIQQLPKPEAGCLSSTKLPSTAVERGLGCISPIKQIELNDASVFES